MWNARWIWPVRPPTGRWAGPPQPDRERANTWALFRRTFEWDGAGPVVARVTADSRYVLWVNGAEASRGPARSVPARLPVDLVDVSPHLRHGTNAVTALVRFYGWPTVWWLPASPVGELGRGSFLFQAGGPGFELVSDSSWRARMAPYEQKTGRNPANAPSPEHFDARQLPADWREPGFDDHDWEAAAELTGQASGLGRPSPPCDPYPLLPVNPLPPMEEILLEASPRADDVWDLGRLSLGLPVVELSSQEGESVEISGGEDLGADGRPVVAPRYWSLRHTARGSSDVVEAFEPVGLRYLHAPGATAVRMRERHFPRPAGPTFECADEVLTRTWQVGVRTLDLCSTDAFLDCPGREQRAWLGDAYVHTVTSLVCNPDLRLVLRHLDLAAEGRRPDGLLPMAAASDLVNIGLTIPDYSLHWIRTLARVVEHTGDVALARRHLATALSIMSYYEAFTASDGLVHDVPGWVFIDWAQCQRGSCMSHLNGLYALALADWAWLLAFAGDAAGHLEVEAREEQAQSGLQSFWDDERGAFVDVLGERRVSQQGNAAVVLAGAATDEQTTRALDYVMDPSRVRLTETPADAAATPGGSGMVNERTPENFDEDHDVVAAQPFFRHFVHQALVHGGRVAEIATRCRDWEHQLESGTLWEYWHMEPGTGSRCHAWSSTAVHDLTRHVLGVRCGSPGWDTAIVEPHLGELAWARGVVPTPHGAITVSVDVAGTLDVAAPTAIEIIR